jgi:hypothetical protein
MENPKKRKYTKRKVYTLPKAIDYSNPTTQQIQAITQILNEVSKGNSVTKAIDKLQTISQSTFTQIVYTNETLKTNYARACEEREVVLFNSALDVARDTSNDFYIDENGNRKPNPVAVQRARLINDTIFKSLSIMNNKKYGTKATIEANVNTTQPLSLEQVNEILNTIDITHTEDNE